MKKRRKRIGGRLLQAAGLVLHLCKGTSEHVPVLGDCVGEFTRTGENATSWSTPFGTSPVAEPGYVRVSSRDPDQRILCDDLLFP